MNLTKNYGPVNVFFQGRIGTKKSKLIFIGVARKDGKIEIGGSEAWTEAWLIPEKIWGNAWEDLG